MVKKLLHRGTRWNFKVVFKTIFKLQITKNVIFYEPEITRNFETLKLTDVLFKVEVNLFNMRCDYVVFGRYSPLNHIL